MLRAEAWVTTPDLSKRMEKAAVLYEQKDEAGTADDGITVRVDTGITYQRMDGFGASFTDASAILIHGRLTPESRSEVMKKLFDRDEGIGMSFLRQPMGACDFNDEIYSYNELEPGETDYGLEKFSIGHDELHIIPLLQEALQLNPAVKVMASPWSPPGWMKTSGHMIAGTLRSECYDVYAEYFVRFIQAYEAAGIPIYAVTTQNEPGYEPDQYPGMIMTAAEQIAFIKLLGPALRNNGLPALIMCYDHNWDITDYACKVLGDPEVSKYVAGTAWHCYGGSHEAMSLVGERFPDKGIWFTEASGGEWIPPHREAFLDQMKHVIRTTRNGSQSVVWWNIALDENNGPTVLRKSTCRGLLKISQATGEVQYNLDYYTMGHISKFVEPGALRIESDHYADELETAAFLNPNGSVVLILSNRTVEEKQVRAAVGTEVFSFRIPAEGAATLKCAIEA